MHVAHMSGCQQTLPTAAWPPLDGGVCADAAGRSSISTYLLLSAILMSEILLPSLCSVT